ncbi:MAG: YchF-related putative GTPase [Candidatus Micrarchaeota archaeon]
MFFGIVGAPNKGKSRFFSAITGNEVGVADYPFTTIDPNKGVAFLRVECACKKLGVKCDARGGHCKNKMREIPVQFLDVAGLVPGAHKGKGLGNQFLDDLREADGFVHLIDASGKTDLEGKAAEDFPIEEEIGFLKKEMIMWILKILKRNGAKFKGKTVEEMGEALSGLGYDKKVLEEAVEKAGMDKKRIDIDGGRLEALACELYKNGKPMVVAANKADLEGVVERIEKAGLGKDVVPCSAEYEYLLTKARKNGLVDYVPGAGEFKVRGGADEKQKAALEKVKKFIEKNKGTGVYRVLEKLVFEKIKMIVVYPVEDENKYSDSMGNVLPDALLMPKGAAVIDLARKVHTELADKFIGAIDARTKRKISKTQELKDGDIIKIISGR